MRRKSFTLMLRVETPENFTSEEVYRSINAILDEPPCDWGDWVVSAATVHKVETAESDD